MLHTTNYRNSFIEIAEDCKAQVGVEPPASKGRKTIAGWQYERISAEPYRYTSDELMLYLHMERNQIENSQIDSERVRLFSKGQACMRSSSLGKKFGWGIHFDENCKMAIYSVDSIEYTRFKLDPAIMHIKAMRSSKH